MANVVFTKWGERDAGEGLDRKGLSAQKGEALLKERMRGGGWVLYGSNLAIL